MKIKNKPSITLLALLSVVSAAIFTGSGCSKKTDTPQGRPPSPVQTAKAQTAPVPVLAPSFGRARAVSDVDIRPQVSGKIIETPFTEGMHVKKGQVLFKIEPDTYQAAVNQAAAQVSGAKADLTQKKATLERNRQLLDQALISQEDYDQLSTAVDAAQATLAETEAMLAKAKIDLDYCTISSPVAGIVGKRLVDAGNVVSASGNQALVNVRSVDPMYLDFTLSESYFPDVRKAMAAGQVEVMVLSESSKDEHGFFQGTLTACDNTVDTQSGTISLRALVDNPDGKLWPGQFVYAFPTPGMISNAVIVPQSAIVLGKSGSYTYVISNETAFIRMVEKGPVFGDAVVTISGINNGDVVVTAGHLGVWPGAKVDIKTETLADKQDMLRKRAANPNVQTLARVLAAKGESIEQISILIGLPAEQIKKIIVNPDKKPEI